MSHSPYFSPETLITSHSELQHVKYLSRLLAGGLVLCFLAQVFHPLVLWQEVLLLGHFLAISSLVWRLPEEKRKNLFFSH